mgnify:CR=1 FL=1
MNRNWKIICCLMAWLVPGGCGEPSAGTDDTDSADTDSTATDSDMTLGFRLLGEDTIDQIEALNSTLFAQMPDLPALNAPLRSNVTVYRLNYPTEANGEPVVASALVAMPTALAGPLPVISFQNGTITRDADAPTRSWPAVNTRVLTGIAAFGYAVVIPDYIGFGASADIVHPYLCADATVDAVVDALDYVLADSRAVDAGYSLSGDLFLLGYSQGGHATLAVARDLEENDSNYTLRAVAAGAGPYDLTAVNNYIIEQDTYAEPFYAPYTLIAFRAMGFITQPLSTFLQEPYASLVEDLFDGQRSPADINAALPTRISELYAPELTSGFDSSEVFAPLREAFVDNSIGPWTAEAPIRLYHGTADVNLPASISTRMQSDLENAGAVSVSFIAIDGRDHSEAGPYMILDALAWFNELNGFNGE